MKRKKTTAPNIRIANPEGAIWHRWDPHIHAPGTFKNDSFGSGDDVFKRYIDALNACNPPIRALGITDYYVLDSYIAVQALHAAGQLPGVDLVFPNIELRFALNAGKGSPINIHLLVDPTDTDHVSLTKRFLREVKFEFNRESYGCTNEDLMALGRAYRPNAENDRHALTLGIEQFKVTASNLWEAFNKSKWASDNIFIATAAGSTDGLAQLQESGLAALREELQRRTTFIFSGKPSDRDFWRGAGAVDLNTLAEKYGGPKPCIHGCDAHKLDKVGKPDQDRYCWLRGDVTFETLKQICFEPSLRVHIDSEPPSRGRSSNTIRQIEVLSADWLKTPKLPINSGLVAVIGARGSGKTALVEMLAAGTDSFDHRHTKRSFLERAKPLLDAEQSAVTWGNDEVTNSALDLDEMHGASESPRVRYLSQQFVDQLCSSDGLADDLVAAIENVIFEAHPPETRLSAASFGELREVRTQSVQRQMTRFNQQIRDASADIALLNEQKKKLPELNAKRAADAAALERLKTDRKSLAPTDNQAVVKRLDEVRDAKEKVSQRISTRERRLLSLSGLEEEIKQFRETDADGMLDRLKTEYWEAALTSTQWSAFKLRTQGDVEKIVKDEAIAVSAAINQLKGPSKGERVIDVVQTLSLQDPFIASDATLLEQTHSSLRNEQLRLEAVVGLDEAKRKRYAELSSKIGRAQTLLGQLDEEIIAAGQAEGKSEAAQSIRQRAYRDLLLQLQNEEEVLKNLYEPLQVRLDAQSGTLRQLTCSVKRIVDIKGWAEAGERLFDRSRQGPFRGVGALTEIIRTELEPTWAKGNAQEIADAMAAFRSDHKNHFWQHAFQDALKSPEARKTWFQQVSDWLYSTDHVSVTYGLEYEGVDIQQLSPGTRGIVLLLLYLSVDTDDERPLIIDQPEENLDPKSIFDELVDRFKEAKSRRQIIIVTHNANLVVNTDADQVIVASRGVHHSNALPDITYTSGGLENPAIRMSVCEILEGGKQAFEERARRLRISLP